MEYNLAESSWGQEEMGCSEAAGAGEGVVGTEGSSDGSGGGGGSSGRRGARAGVERAAGS